MPISLDTAYSCTAVVSGKQSNRPGITQYSCTVYVYTARSESPGNHAPVPTKSPAKLVPHQLKPNTLDTQERGIPEDK